MTDRKKRTDIYNLKVLAEMVKKPNAYQKLNLIFKGYPELANDSDTIKKTIEILEREYKKTIKELKSIVKNIA